jgi:hypothetical protein
MPFSPSDLPWWGWLLCSLGAWVVYVIAHAFTEDVKGAGGCLAIPIALISGLAGLITGAMAVIRFVKWVWGG